MTPAEEEKVIQLKDNGIHDSLKKYILVRRKPFTDELIDSESLENSKPLEFKGKERQRIFGAD